MKKFFSMLLLLCGFVTLSATLVVNAAEPVATFSSATVVTTSSYAKYENEDWIVTFGGNNASVGSNSGNKAKCVLGADYAYVGEPMSFTATTANTCAVISKKAIANVKEVVYSCKDAGNGGYKSTDIYLVSSDSANAGFTQIGEKKVWATSLTFEVNEEGSKYYALVFNLTTNTNFRIDEVVAEFMPNEVAGVTYYDVTFDTQGGSEIEAERVAENASAPKPADPKKDGYTFEGWYKEAECENAFDFATDVITEDTTIYAKWEEDLNTHSIITATNYLDKNGGKTSAYGDYNGSHTLDGLEFDSYQVSNQGGFIQFQKSAGYFKNSIAISGHLKSITMDISEGEFTVSTSTSELTANAEDAITLTKTNNKLVVTNPDDAFFRIQVGGAIGKVSSIDFAYEFVEKTTYTVSFNEGLGTFVEGKGTDITAELGTTTTVVLPKATDMATRPYKHTVLSGWNDGTQTHKPGASVEVSGNKTFSAVYTAPSNLTIAQAIEVADIAGTTATTYNFTTKATIKEINNKNVVLTDSSTTETFVAYNPSNLSSLSVGDQVTVVGKIKVYNSVKEYDAPKVTVTKPAYATAFQAEVTKASLKLDGDSISIRFGNIISAASFNQNATYGVVVAKDAADLNGLTKDVLESLNPNSAVAVECTPVKVNAQGEADANGEYYQFALVLTDVPQAEFTAEIVAAMYVIDTNNNVYLAQAKTASVKSVAAAYLEGDTSNFSANTIDILNILANA